MIISRLVILMKMQNELCIESEFPLWITNTHTQINNSSLLNMAL